MTIDPRNFLLNTDYPMDQIIYMTNGSFVADTYNTIYQFTHGLSFTPLLVASWSFDSDFSTCKECFQPLFNDIDGLYVQCFSNSTNVTFAPFNLTGSNNTVYYRVFGFMPSDVNVDASPTASLSSNFQLNTDFNYTKLDSSLSGIIPAAATTTITHNYGYRPQVMAWSKDASIAYGTEMINKDYDSYVNITNTDVIVRSSSNDVHLRIYADSQL